MSTTLIEAVKGLCCPVCVAVKDRLYRLLVRARTGHVDPECCCSHEALELDIPGIVEVLRLLEGNGLGGKFEPTVQGIH